jgi:hypothetical protein
MPLPGWELATSPTATCTSCGSRNQALIFPAARLAAAPVQIEAALDGQASCFDHPGNRAVTSCRQCGRFVCQLCSIEFGEGVFCPSCIAAGAGSASGANPETSRTLYDSMALLAPTLSLAMWPFTIITGPGAVVLSILKWRAPLSLVRRTRLRFVAAALIGLAETAGWVALIVYAVMAATKGRS